MHVFLMAVFQANLLMTQAAGIRQHSDTAERERVMYTPSHHYAFRLQQPQQTTPPRLAQHKSIPTIYQVGELHLTKLNWHLKKNGVATIPAMTCHRYLGAKIPPEES